MGDRCREGVGRDHRRCSTGRLGDPDAIACVVASELSLDGGIAAM